MPRRNQTGKRKQVAKGMKRPRGWHRAGYLELLRKSQQQRPNDERRAA